MDLKIEIAFGVDIHLKIASGARQCIYRVSIYIYKCETARRKECTRMCVYMMLCIITTIRIRSMYNI